jgi:hypothetical protein
MVALFVTIDILEIGKLKLNINEYLTLIKIRHDDENKSFPFEIDYKYIQRLIDKEYIKEHYYVDTTQDPHKQRWSLTEKGLAIFEGEDLFEEFYSLFPNYVETGIGRRAISAKDPNSISGKNTHEIWKRTTKNKPGLQRKVIECLKRELEHRRSTNSMSYLQGIDTWLRQATWEKWEDIPDKKSGTNYIKL